jgi:hypothetical protein
MLASSASTAEGGIGLLNPLDVFRKLPSSAMNLRLHGADGQA